jgi:hypothetical protein
MSARGRVSLPKISATVIGVLMACAVSACSSDGRSSSPSSKSTTAARAQSNTATASARTLPSVGEVIIQKEPDQGNVIRDRATGGKRFFLSGIQAGECLSFLNANPRASAKDVRAACPGEAVAEIVRQKIATQARKKR